MIKSNSLWFMFFPSKMWVMYQKLSYIDIDCRRFKVVVKKTLRLIVGFKNDWHAYNLTVDIICISFYGKILNEICCLISGPLCVWNHCMLWLFINYSTTN